VKNPKSKTQNPNKFQAPNFNGRRVYIWKVGYWNLFGIWDLGFGISSGGLS
jgi:hypothetical protein